MIMGDRVLHLGVVLTGMKTMIRLQAFSSPNMVHHPCPTNATQSNSWDKHQVHSLEARLLEDCFPLQRVPGQLPCLLEGG